jgi:hypothetical protein
MNRRVESTLLALLVIFGVGIVLRGWNLIERPIWEDESYTWSASQGPLTPLLLGRNDQHHGPLSPILVRLLTALTGSASPWVLRLPAFACGVLCIPAAYWLGRTICNAGLGLGAALLVAVDANMVDQSHQARMYSMLMLVTLVTLRQAALLLRDPSPPAGKRPWLCLGLLLGLLMLINFGGIALWLGLAAAGGWTVACEARRGQWDSRGRARLQGLAWTYLTAVAVGMRGLWLFCLMSCSGHSRAGVSVSGAFSEVGNALLSLEDFGPAGPWVIALAILGLVLLYRRDRNLAMLVSATALATLAMVYCSRFVHPVFAARYLTMLQPALWLGLAAVPISFQSAAWRRGAAAVLMLLGGLHVQQSVALLRAGYWSEWEFFRTAAQWIQARRAPDDAVFVSPNLSYRILARYYGLVDTDGEEFAKTISAPDSGHVPRLPSRLWVLVNVHTPPGQQDLRRLLAWYGHGRDYDTEGTLRELFRPQFAVVCFDRSAVACWEYRVETIRVEPVSVTVLAQKPTLGRR